jgi:hypothetical protein
VDASSYHSRSGRYSRDLIGGTSEPTGVQKLLAQALLLMVFLVTEWFLLRSGGYHLKPVLRILSLS